MYTADDATKKDDGASASSESAAAGGAPKAPAASAPGKEKAKVKKSKSKKIAKKAKSAKKAKKEAVAKSYPGTAKKNPYREGTMKAKAFALFAKGGTRESMIAAIVKSGATKNTASSWIQFFRRYVATGKK